MWIALEFNESAWLTSILGKWSKIKISLKKDILKLMDYRTFGKAMENLRKRIFRKRVDVRLVTDKNLRMNLANKTNTRIFKKFN